MNHQLKRVSSTGTDTFGVLLDDAGNPVCLSLELPWKNNQPVISCIPAGVYPCEWQVTPKHPEGVYVVLGVDGRTMIELHPGNTSRDTDGCLLLGQMFGTLDGVPAVLSSRDAYAAFLALHPAREPFSLTITGP